MGEHVVDITKVFAYVFSLARPRASDVYTLERRRHGDPFVPF